jgi:hypothetical protein
MPAVQSIRHWFPAASRLQACLSFILLGIAALSSVGSAQAQSPIPQSFFVENVAYPTTNQPPLALGAWRFWSTLVSGSAAVNWASVNTAAGVYATAGFDAAAQVAKTNNVPVLYTLGNVPAWVTALPTAAQQQQAFYTFVSYIVARECPALGEVEEYNEFNSAPSWLGTPSAMATIAENIYPLIKTACPLVTVLSPSISSGTNTTFGSVDINNFYAWDQMLQGCAASGLPCFDALNVHGYVPIVYMSVTDNSVVYAPENIVDVINDAKGIAAQDGFGAQPLDISEGFAGIATNDTATSMDTPIAAANAARYMALIASAGISQFGYFSYGTANVSINSGGTSLGLSPINGLDFTGRALKVMESWLIGGRFTSPISRIAGANIVRTPPNDPSARAGIVSGTFTPTASVCNGAPAGTGSLPTDWSAGNQHPTMMNVYVVGTGTSSGLPYIDVRYCGIDQTAGSGYSTNSLYFDTGAGSSTQNQAWATGVNLQIVAGSLSCVYDTDLVLAEVGADQSTLSIYLNGGPLLTNNFQFRTYQQSSAPTAISPRIYFRPYYNSTTPCPFDVTIRVANPVADTGTRWDGALLGSDGNVRYLVWDASGGPSNYSVPAGYNYWQDIRGYEHPIGGGTVQLSASPILIEQVASH